MKLSATFMTGVRTHIVAHVKVTDSNANDSPQFPGLMAATTQQFKVKRVCADKQHSSVYNLECADDYGAVAYIPFKDGTTGASGGLWAQMFHYYTAYRDDFLGIYHQRSNAESTVWMVKENIGPSLWSKTDLAMKNEVLVKFLCHNIQCVIMSMYELGIVGEFTALKDKRA